MKTVKLLLFLASVSIWVSCGDRRTTSSGSTEIDAPGVGMAPDSANQKLDSAIKSPDTIGRKPEQ